MLQDYHFTWLETHADRTVQWLEEKLREGFQVHHVDGDHSNDESSNLILIDGSDHLMLHSGALQAGIVSWRKKFAGKRFEGRPVKHVFPTRKHLEENKLWDLNRETAEDYRSWYRREIEARA